MRLALRLDGLAEALANTNIRSDAELARSAGITPGHLWRVQAGRSSPGNSFIAGLLDVFGTEAFSLLFAIVPDDDDADLVTPT